MKAQILPLKGKYLGTIVMIKGVGEIEINLGHEYTDFQNQLFVPSERQMRFWGVETVDEARKEDLIDSEHFENKVSYAVAKTLEEALAEKTDINKLKEKNSPRYRPSFILYLCHVCHRTFQTSYLKSPEQCPFCGWNVSKIKESENEEKE